jgi:acyl carrier protein
VWEVIQRSVHALDLGDIALVDPWRHAQAGQDASLGLMARLHVLGIRTGLTKVVRASPHVALPLYPFERQRYWYKEGVSSADEQVAIKGVRETEKPRSEPSAVTIEPGAAPLVPKDFELGSMNYRERLDRLRTIVRDEVAQVLSFDLRRIDPKQGFFDMGMDSLMAARLRNRLEQRLGCKCQTSLVLEHPSVEALALELHRILGGSQPNGASRRAPKPTNRDDIAAQLLAELESA